MYLGGKKGGGPQKKREESWSKKDRKIQPGKEAVISFPFDIRHRGLVTAGQL